MDSLQGHWAPHLRPNKALPPSSASPKPTPSPPPAPTFLNLPRELRDKIYLHLTPTHLSFTLKNQTRQRTYYSNGLKTEHFPPNHYLATAPLLLTNHQLRAEMLAAIYAHTPFRLLWRRRAHCILACLAAVPAAAKTRIRHLVWADWSLHTGGDARSYRGWGAVMRYVDAQFTSLRSVRCSFPSGEDGRHRFHNWEVPRLAVGMLVEGRIERVVWRWCLDGFSAGAGYTREGVLAVGVRLLGIPYVEGVDGDKGVEFRRLLKDEGALDGGDPLDRWALECLRRPRHRLVETRLAGELVLTRG